METQAREPELSDQDILDAMTRVPGYIDISTEDFRVLYRLAYRHSRERAAQPATVQTRKAQEPPRPPVLEIIRSWLGALLGIATVAGVNHLLFPADAQAMMLGSFGATAVLVFGAMRSPLAQPRNVIGGHFLSALVGVLCWMVLKDHLWLAEAVAVATAIAAMHLTRTLHPPGGATALIAVIGSATIHQLGFLYALVPATLGPVLMVGVGLVVNNAGRARRYPETWF